MTQKYVNNQYHGLSRRLCLQRWSFCNFAATGGQPGGLSWKRYFLRRCHLEANMTKGRSGGYTCKSLRGHTGRKSLTNVPGFVRRVITWSCLLSIRQGGGFGLPAGGFCPPSPPVERQCHSLQRLHGWYSPSMEHPNCQCSTISISGVFNQELVCFCFLTLFLFVSA